MRWQHWKIKFELDIKFYALINCSPLEQTWEFVPQNHLPVIHHQDPDDEAKH
jgi:hypothetical protein